MSIKILVVLLLIFIIRLFYVIIKTTFESRFNDRYANIREDLLESYLVQLDIIISSMSAVPMLPNLSNIVLIRYMDKLRIKDKLLLFKDINSLRDALSFAFTANNEPIDAETVLMIKKAFINIEYIKEEFYKTLRFLYWVHK